MGLAGGGGGTSYRRDAALTVKRGEAVLEEADVRREAWYAREEAWKAADGEGGAEMVGEDEVSMSSGGGVCEARYGCGGRCPLLLPDTVIIGGRVVEKEGTRRERSAEAQQACGMQKKGARRGAANLGCRTAYVEHVGGTAPAIGPLNRALSPFPSRSHDTRAIRCVARRIGNSDRVVIGSYQASLSPTFGDTRLSECPRPTTSENSIHVSCRKRRCLTDARGGNAGSRTPPTTCVIGAD
jgi:hypothetical protein